MKTGIKNTCKHLFILEIIFIGTQDHIICEINVNIFHRYDNT